MERASDAAGREHFVGSSPKQDCCAFLGAGGLNAPILGAQNFP